MKQTSTVAMINRKGGCGKTSSVFHIGGCLALRQGRSVLLVDADPQASLTQGFFGSAAAGQIPKRETLAALFDDTREPRAEEMIKPTSIEGLSIVCASPQLDQYNVPVPTLNGEAEGEFNDLLAKHSARLQRSLPEFLKEVADRFDLVLIDCPPNLHLCSWSALLASDFVVVPVQPEDFGAQGITQVQKAIDLAIEKYNPRLRLLGYLVTMHQRRLRVHSVYNRQLRGLYGDQVFTATVPAQKDFKEAVALHQPVSQYKPHSLAGQAIEEVAKELLARTEVVSQQPREFLFIENRMRKVG
jgi:chromosome partitioning protein